MEPNADHIIEEETVVFPANARWWFDYDALDEQLPPVRIAETLDEETLVNRVAQLQEQEDQHLDILRAQPLNVVDYTPHSRVWPNGCLARAHTQTPVHDFMEDFLMNGGANEYKAFAWTALWRWEDPSVEYLDEIVLMWNHERRPRVIFNGGTQHGHWEYLDMKYLRVMMNVHGLEGAARQGLKYVVFQKIPGTRTWIGVKDQDHGWTVILSETTL